MLLRLVDFRGPGSLLRLSRDFLAVPVKNGYELCCLLQNLRRICIIRADDFLEVFEGFRDDSGVFLRFHNYHPFLDAIELDSDFVVHFYIRRVNCLRQSGPPVIQGVRELLAFLGEFPMGAERASSRGLET